MDWIECSPIESDPPFHTHLFTKPTQPCLSCFLARYSAHPAWRQRRSRAREYLCPLPRRWQRTAVHPGALGVSAIQGVQAHPLHRFLWPLLSEIELLKQNCKTPILDLLSHNPGLCHDQRETKRPPGGAATLCVQCAGGSGRPGPLPCARLQSNQEYQQSRRCESLPDRPRRDAARGS